MTDSWYSHSIVVKTVDSHGSHCCTIDNGPLLDIHFWTCKLWMASTFSRIFWTMNVKKGTQEFNSVHFGQNLVQIAPEMAEKTLVYKKTSNIKKLWPYMHKTTFLGSSKRLSEKILPAILWPNSRKLAVVRGLSDVAFSGNSTLKSRFCPIWSIFTSPPNTEDLNFFWTFCAFRVNSIVNFDFPKKSSRYSKPFQR